MTEETTRIKAPNVEDLRVLAGMGIPAKLDPDWLRWLCDRVDAHDATQARLETLLGQGERWVSIGDVLRWLRDGPRGNLTAIPGRDTAEAPEQLAELVATALIYHERDGEFCATCTWYASAHGPAGTRRCRYPCLTRVVLTGGDVVARPPDEPHWTGETKVPRHRDLVDYVDAPPPS